MTERNELQAAAQERVGRTIDGKFRLLRLLGVGGMAAVYEASHRNGKRVALKLLRPSLAGSERQRKRFMREACAANSIDHPGIVQIHDDGIDKDGTAYLVMELLEGHSVGELQARAGGKLELSLVLDIADQLLDVLIAAHARGVIHRDIKPDNLFLTHQGELKLLDLGIARLFEQVPGATLDTHAGAMLGTPAFMPQEQARGRWSEIDARTDLWAVGATLFSLLSGEHVYPAQTPNEQLGLAMSVPARSLSVLRADLPLACVQLVDRALCFEREARWADALSMQAAVRACRANVPAADGGMQRSITASTLTTHSDELEVVVREAWPPSSFLEGSTFRSKRTLWLGAALGCGLIALATTQLMAADDGAGPGIAPQPQVLAALQPPSVPQLPAPQTQAPAIAAAASPVPVTAVDAGMPLVTASADKPQSTAATHPRVQSALQQRRSKPAAQAEQAAPLDLLDRRH